MTVLLTGATGFVGGEVLTRLVASGEDVVALARRPEAAGALRDRGARVVEGDLTDVAVALPDAETVIHCAASVSFGLPLEEARRINIGGTRAVAEHVTRSGARLVHVSTAYVAGRHSGVFGEDDLDRGQAFRNTYEQTKLEAEQLVRDACPDAIVLRPSIVVGDSRTGWTSAFNVLYWPMRAFSRGLLTAIPARARAHVDVVPVDFVADAIAHIATERRDVGGALHLVAGRAAVTVGELIELACEAFDRDPPRLVPPDAVDAVELAARSPEAARYLPYFDMDVRFDDARSGAVLAPAGITAPGLRDYFARLVEYAERARWGKRRVVLA